MKNVKYFWVQFYPSSDWQIVKFWTDNNGIEYMKGLDWGSSHKKTDFSNKFYILGEEILSTDR